MVGASRNGLLVMTPALLISRFTSAQRSAAAVTWSGFLMSSSTGIPGVPGPPSRAGVRAAAQTGLPPRRASSCTKTWPSPRPAPVTRATESAICMIPILGARSQVAGAGTQVAQHVVRVGQLAAVDRQAAAADAAGQLVAQVLQLADALVQGFAAGPAT